MAADMAAHTPVYGTSARRSIPTARSTRLPTARSTRSSAKWSALRGRKTLGEESVEFVEIAASQPEVLARHCTEAGLIEKAAELWGTAGQRSVARSALVEAVEQFMRALAQIATCARPIRREPPRGHHHDNST
jgi:hypothetical protein